MKRILTLIATALLCMSAMAQNNTSNSSSTTLKAEIKGPQDIYINSAVSSSTEGELFELVFPTDKETKVEYRINKETGEVWLIDDDKYYNLQRDSSKNDIADDGRINYQLIISPSAKVFLMNLNTGELWVRKSPSILGYSKDYFALLKER